MKLLLISFFAFCIFGGNCRLLTVVHESKLQNQFTRMKKELKARGLFLPPMLKATMNAPEMFTVLTPMVKNPNLEITTYGELENVDLKRDPLVHQFSTPALMKLG